MSTQQTFVIAGASLAGAKAAETLRAEGFDGRVVLIGEEAVRPYERPPLSKAYLRGEVGFEEAAVHPEDFYLEHEIELLTSTTVTSIDPAGKEVSLDPGGRLTYDQLLLATGAEPRKLEIPGADLEGIHYLRSVSSCDALRDALDRATRVVVVGAGWIGSEVAASARQLGKEVALIEGAQVPLERVLGTEVGTMFRDLHADHGVQLHMGVGVEAFRGSTTAEEVVLADGSVVAGEVFVVGVGVAPRTGLAEAAGLTLDNGVVVDEHLAASRAGNLGRGRRRQRLSPDLRYPDPPGTLVVRAQPGACSCQKHAGPGRRIYKDPVFLLGSVRPGDGIQRLRPEVGPSCLSRGSRRA